MSRTQAPGKQYVRPLLTLTWRTMELPTTMVEGGGGGGRGAAT